MTHPQASEDETSRRLQAQKIEQSKFRRGIIEMLLIDAGVTDPGELQHAVNRVDQNMVEISEQELDDYNEPPCEGC